MNHDVVFFVSIDFITWKLYFACANYGATSELRVKSEIHHK